MDRSYEDHDALEHTLSTSRSPSQSRNSSPVTIRGSEHQMQSPSSSETSKSNRTSSQDNFLTPRAQSPFWPTNLASLPGQYPLQPSSSSLQSHHRHTSPSHSPSTPTTPEDLRQEPIERQILEVTPTRSTTDVHPAPALVPLLTTPSPSRRGTAKQLTAKKLSGNRRSSSRIYSDALEETVSSQLGASPPIPVRRASVSLPQDDDLFSTVASPPLLEAAVWADQLAKSLIAEGLPETAKAAEQDLRQELRNLVVPPRTSSTLDEITSEVPLVADSGAGPSSSPASTTVLATVSIPATAIDMSGWSAHHASDISRTPSTSTAGSSSSMAKSQASTETAPSSVLTEDEIDAADVTADTTGGSVSNSNTSKDTVGPAIASDSKYVQTKLRRYHALVELVETERSYTNDLAILVHIYLDALPMQPFFEDHPARLDTVVRNAPDLLAIHCDIALMLEGILERESIAVSDAGCDTDKALSKGVDNAIIAVGNIFATADQLLLPYRDFCARHAEASSVIREAERRHNGEDFAQFERMCSSLTRSSRPGSLSSSKNSSTTEVHRLSRASSFSTSTTTVPALRGQSSLSTLTSITPVVSAPAENNSNSSLPITPGTGEGTTMRHGGRLSFQDLLIKPVQRLCLYPLVLHTLLKHTGSDDGGREELEAALATVKRVADEVDEAGKRREHFLLAELVASRVEPRAQITRSLLSSYGRVYLSGTLDTLYHHFTIAPLMGSLKFRFLGLFLYQGWLLIVKVTKSGSYEPRYWFPLHNARLSSTEEQQGHLPHAFRVTVSEEHHFELAASSSRERALWVNALTTAIATAPLVPESGVSPTSPSAVPASFPSNLSGPGLGIDVPGSPASSRLVEVASRQQMTAPDTSNMDPLRSFLQRQAAGPGSSDVMVRLTTLPQRFSVDKGMVFSDSILSARAITHKDGSFQPGGSLVKTGHLMSHASSQATSPVLASWQAANSAPQGPITAAVGVAMGLARSAKRSSSKSATNVFEAAAQQYLAAEESRLADESKMSAREASRMSGGDEGSSTDMAAPAKQGGHRRMRSSFAGRTGLRPMSTIFPDFENAVQSSPVSASSPLWPSAGQVLGSPISSNASPMEDPDLQSAPAMPFVSTNSGKKRTGSLYGSSFRDAFSRRHRSQSVDLDSQVAEVQGSNMPESPQSSDSANGGPFLHVSHPSSPTATDALQPGQVSRSSYIKRAVGNTASYTTSNQSERDLSREVDLSPALQGARLPGASLDVAALAVLTQSPRKRTISGFGANLGLMAPPFGNLRRSLTSGFRGGIRGGSRSADSSRRSSVADATSDASGGSVSSSSSRPLGRSSGDQETTVTTRPSPVRHGKVEPFSSPSGSNSSERTSLGRSATDTSLLLQQQASSSSYAGGDARATPLPRTKSTPLYKASSLSNLSKRSVAAEQSSTATTTTALAPFQASGHTFASSSTANIPASTSMPAATSSSASSLARSLSRRLFIGGTSRRNGSYSLGAGAGAGKGIAVGGVDVEDGLMAPLGLPSSLAEEVGEIGPSSTSLNEPQTQSQVPWSFGSAGAANYGPGATAATLAPVFVEDVSPNTTPLGNEEGKVWFRP